MTTPIASAADELRACYGCAELAGRGIDAVPAFDDTGRPTGRVAIDPDVFCDWLDDLYQEGED